MNLVSVEPYQPSHKSLWNTFVSKSKNATFLCHRDFMEYHKDRFEDFSLLIFKGEKLIGLLPAHKVEDTLYSHLGLTYGGLILNEAAKLSDVLNGLYALLKFLHDNSITTLEIKQIPSIYCDAPSDEMQYLIFLLKGILTRRDTLSVVDIVKNISFSKDRKEGSKRGSKHNLQIKEVQEFDEFWKQILIPNLKQRHETLPVHSLDEIKLLKSRFPNNIRQFNVYQEDRIVAGTTIFETKHVAHSQYISGNLEKNTIGSLDVLHDNLITNVFKHKKYFDFGISNENQGKNINEGLQYWKEGFGARTIVQDFYRISTENYGMLKDVMK